MIFVAGTMNMTPAIIDAFARDVLAMRPKVLSEQGCHHYSLLVEDALTGLVNVMEIWDDDAALKAHFKTPWIIEFFGNYGPQMVATTVQVYDIAGTPRPLPPM